MTLFLVDCSKYQVERPDPLNLEQARAAGFGIVNIALDRGKSDDVLSSWAAQYAAEARRLGMGISTYRWLDNRLSGVESARRAYDRMCALGGPAGMAHIVDCEDNASQQILRDYVVAMQELLGRSIAIYSADWWLEPKGWHLADLTPFLHAAPNDGYLAGYPGDESPHWHAGYGGWTDLSIMQYAVEPLPGTGDCSLSAFRDSQVWTTLTGGEGMRSANMQVLTDQMKADHPGVVIYGIGDEAHKGSPSGHNEDDTPGSKPEREDADTKPEHRAIDAMIGPNYSPEQAEADVQMLVTVPENQRRLIYVIYRRRIWSASNEWIEDYYDGSDPHDNHWHASGDPLDDENRDHWVLSGDSEDEDMQPVLVKLAGEDTVRLVTMGVGHLPVHDMDDLHRWQSFMSANKMATTIYDWPADWLPQCGPDLSAMPSATITDEQAEIIAQKIIDAGANDLSQADLDTIAGLIIDGSKQAAREGTGTGS